MKRQLGKYSEEPVIRGLPSKALMAGIEAIPDLLIAARVARGMTQRDLARFVGLKPQHIHGYETSRYQSVSLSRIAWMAKALDIDVDISGELVGNRAMRKFDVNHFEAFPVGEMYQRGWLGPHAGNVKNLHRNSKKLLETFFGLSGVANRRRYARTNGSPLEAALIAWEVQLLRSVEIQPQNPRFDRDRIAASWIKGLVALSRKRDGLQQIRHYLSLAGIMLVIEPALPGMKVDAAVLKSGNSTVIVGLTLQNRREEEFWPALLHALAHARLHVSGGQWDTIFHKNWAPAFEPFEEDADVFAREALIPSKDWARCASRIRPTAKTIAADAALLRVSTAVIVARLRCEPGAIAVPSIPSARKNMEKALIDSANAGEIVG